MILQQEGVTGVGGKRSQMTPTADDQAGEETHGGQMQQTTNRNRGKIKNRRQTQLKKPKKLVPIQLIFLKKLHFQSFLKPF